MSFNLVGNIDGRHIYNCLSSDTKTTADINVLSICFETDTLDVYEFDGAAWVKIRGTDSSGKAARNVVIADGAGVGVIGSDYDSDKTVASASSTREAIPSGTKSIWVHNQGATNFMRFRFGDSTVDATVLTGFYLEPDTAISVPVPGSATHWAYIADTADVTASAVWGG